MYVVCGISHKTGCLQSEPGPHTSASAYAVEVVVGGGRGIFSFQESEYSELEFHFLLSSIHISITNIHIPSMNILILTQY